MRLIFFKNQNMQLRYHVIYLLVFFLICLQTNLQGQETKGILRDTAGNVISGATVQWVNIDQMDSGNVITDVQGSWLFPYRGNLQLKISYVGFRSLDTLVHISANVSYLQFKLWPLDGMLSEVRLEAQRVQIKEDTVSYLVDSSMYRKNDKVEDVLKNLPGVQVDRDGTVTAQGKQVTKVKVNGKEFFNGDVTTATKELYADMVDKIQIIDDYGDQAAFTGIKDGDPTKTMNIQLRKDKNKGYFGNISGGAGTEDRYQGKISMNRFNNEQQISLIGTINNINESSLNLGNGGSGGIGGMMMGVARSMGMGRGGAGAANLAGGQGSNSDGVTQTSAFGINYRDEWGPKISVYGSYSLSSRVTETIQSTSQQTLFNKQTQDFQQLSNTDRNALNHRASLNIEWKIDSFNYLKINPSARINDTRTDYFSSFSNFSGLDLRSNGNQIQLTNSNTIDWNTSLIFNRKFKKRGRTLSLQMSTGTAISDNQDSVLNLNYLSIPNTGIILLNQSQKIAQDNENINNTIRVSYSEPIDKKRNLELNYNLSNQKQGNDREVGLLDTIAGNFKTSDSLSNLYQNDYWGHRIGLNFRTTEKKYNYTIGLGIQPARMETRSEAPVKAIFVNHLVNFFPVIRFAYNFSKSKSLNLNYNGNTNQPSNTQLQPVADRSNFQFITIGNPALKPEFTHTFSMRYNRFDMISGNVFFGNISASFTQDKIVNSTRLLRGGAQEISYLNTNGFYTVTGFYNISKPIMNRKFVFNLGGNVLYNNQIGYLVDSANKSIRNIGRNWVLGQRFSTDIKIKKWLEMTWSVNWSMNNQTNSYQKSLDATVVGWTFSHYARVFLPKDFILNYEIDRSLNIGYSANTLSNPIIIQASLEKQVLKSRNLSLKLQCFDLLNQNIGISRTANANGFTDTRTNRLGRYVMLTAVFRINKFGVSNTQTNNPTMPFMPGGGEFKMRMPGGGGGF
jgi:hypothetical protein